MSIVPIIVILIVGLFVSFVARVFTQRYEIAIFALIITALTTGIISYYSFGTIAIGEKILGKKHQDNTTPLNNLGERSNDIGNPTKMRNELLEAIKKFQDLSNEEGVSAEMRNELLSRFYDVPELEQKTDVSDKSLNPSLMTQPNTED